MLVSGMVAVIEVLLTYVVTRSDPSNNTVESDTKFVPVTVMVKVGSPTFLLFGEMLVIVGVADAGAAKLATNATLNIMSTIAIFNVPIAVFIQVHLYVFLNFFIMIPILSTVFTIFGYLQNIHYLNFV